MTPKEKAQYLVDKFTPHAYGVWDKNGSKEERYHSKQCALIAVDEILKAFEVCDCHFVEKELEYWLYWLEVKREINTI